MPTIFHLIDRYITPSLQALHWLPVKERIQFKILLLTYKCVNGQGPSYLKDLLNDYKPSRSLRSEDKGLLRIPKSHTKNGEKRFSSTAPQLWNNLPYSIKSSHSTNTFKSYLKTHLFKKAFNL